MSVTTTNNLIIPEVVSSLIDGSLGDGVTLLPLAEQDDTLVGQPGDTLKFPVFSYIGKAAAVAENGQIIPGQLTASMKSVPVHTYAKAMRCPACSAPWRWRWPRAGWIRPGWIGISCAACCAPPGARAIRSRLRCWTLPIASCAKRWRTFWAAAAQHPARP